MEDLMKSYENMIYLVLGLSILIVVIFIIISVIIIINKKKKNIICSKCGKRIEKDSSYCKYCGTKVDLHL